MPGDTDTALDDTTTPPAARAPRLSLATYDIGEVIGKGGMGEVLLATDPRIGRDVAIKRMVAAEPSPEDVARFVREAKIQARLEHPAIVPVHEIGNDAAGRPYFTMKRLAGTTLHDVLREGKATQQRMLRALVDVCLAVELAHTRGVVHRDLKPSNIMLGNFGEVYVLDWGIARVVAEAEQGGDAIAPPSGETEAGTMLGTPGYMAPEQVRDATQVAPAADVYSLGCVLFEILTGGVPLHPRGVAGLASTLAHTIEAPSARAFDRGVPLELDEACLAALAKEPVDRPTARELADRIQRYLDGDRDLERRKAVAAEYFAAARVAAEDPDRRAEALRAAGRAVGLDPSSEAAALLTRLLLEPLRNDPPELTRRLAEHDRDESVRSARSAPALMLIYIVILPMLLWAGVTNWTIVLGTAALVVGCSGFAVYQVVTCRTYDLINLILGAIICVLVTQLIGPFVIVPVAIAAMLMGLGQQASLIDRPPLVLIGIGVGTFLLPLALEAVGVFARTFTIGEGTITLTSPAVHISGVPTYALLIVPNVCVMAVSARFARMIGTERRKAARALETRAWMLQQLLPM